MIQFHRRASWLLCAGMALSIVACGGSSDGASTGTAASGAGYEIVSDADVAVGLADVSAILATLPTLQQSSEAEARAAVEAMYTRWFEFEGTIRANDKDLSLQMEDGLVGAKIGVQENRPEKLSEGIAEFASATDQYLAARP